MGEKIPADIKQVAANIMDQACLGEHWAKNGVDRALREDIARAILAERERCAKIVEVLPSRYGHLLPREEVSAAIRTGVEDGRG